MAELSGEARERLGLWERLPQPLAPLSERQRDSVLELREAFPCLPLPPEVGERRPPPPRRRGSGSSGSRWSERGRLCGREAKRAGSPSVELCADSGPLCVEAFSGERRKAHGASHELGAPSRDCGALGLNWVQSPTFLSRGRKVLSSSASGCRWGALLWNPPPCPKTHPGCCILHAVSHPIRKWSVPKAFLGYAYSLRGVRDLFFYLHGEAFSDMTPAV